MEPKLVDNMLRQLAVRSVLRGRVGVGETMPCSRSSLSDKVAAIGKADDEEVLAVSAAWTWMASSSLSSWYGSYLGFDGEPRARDRTTSPLHIGHVRRRVVNHGVLAFGLDKSHRILNDQTYMQSTWNS